MCGIVGIVAKNANGLLKPQEESFFQMLYADALRGEDSTGVIAVENNGAYTIAKEAASAEWFIWQLKNKHKEIPGDMWLRGKAYIGHNRKKTSGSISDETAHPFVVDKTFAMVHNGTLWGHEKMAKTEVDSEALAIHLHKAFSAGGEDLKKVKEEVEVVLADVNGAYAVAIYDQKQHRVHLLRNKERPLAIIETENAWYFMSEPLMGAWILARNNYPYDKLKVDAVLEHQLVTFDLDTNEITKEMLTPKKAPTPVTKLKHHFGSTVAGVLTRHTSTNKNSPIGGEKDRKRFRKNWIGKRISFWPDDYLEKNFPLTIENGETEVVIMGAHEEIAYWHTLLGEIDMAQLGLKYAEDLTSKKWTGIIDDITIQSNGCLQLQLKGCKPMVESKATLALTHIDDAKKKAFSRELGHLTLDQINEMYETKKHTYATWQVEAVKTELHFRSSIQNVEEASTVAKAKGCYPLRQEQRAGRFVFLNEEGRIFYESPIVVH